MSKRKLLLADDSITIQKVVNLTFADEEIEVISVGDGNSAMDKLREESPDMVMADVNMPGLNGYEICEKIKLSDNEFADIPVILLVGSFEPFDENEAERVGADDYLTKPFQSISQLVEKVSALLKLNEDQSFADTAEMFVDGNDSKAANESSANPFDESFTNDSKDDEMIQTAQVGSIPIDDGIKFNSTSGITSIENEADISEESNEFESPDFHKTQPLTEDDFKDLAVADTEIISEDATDTVSLETDLDIGRASVENETSADAGDVFVEKIDVNSNQSNYADLPMPEAASILELDEINLLDLPPLEGNGDEPKIETNLGTVAKTFAESEAEYYTELTEDIDLDVSQANKNDIAKVVVERVSEKAIREIAWEVVPELAELIITKMAKEKIKD